MPIHLTTEHSDPENVQGLSPYILLTHVNDAFQSESSTSGGGGDTVLSCTSLGDDTLLAQSTSEQDLQRYIR
jgi:hypothetical protein